MQKKRLSGQNQGSGERWEKNMEDNKGFNWYEKRNKSN